MDKGRRRRVEVGTEERKEAMDKGGRGKVTSRESRKVMVPRVSLEEIDQNWSKIISK